jgi:hypothetical protein
VMTVLMCCVVLKWKCCVDMLCYVL